MDEEWQTHHTAPTDGTPFIACYWDGKPWSESWQIWQMPKTVYYGGFQRGAPGKAKFRDSTGRPVAFTHWRPLMSPPTTICSDWDG